MGKTTSQTLFAGAKRTKEPENKCAMCGETAKPNSAIQLNGRLCCRKCAIKIAEKIWGDQKTPTKLQNMR